METDDEIGPLRTTEEGAMETGEETGTTTMAVPATSDIEGLDGSFVSIHGRYIRNEAGGIVSEITDLDYVMRFLILGRTKIRYEQEHKGLQLIDKTDIRRTIERLINGKKGKEVVDLIKEISTNYRNISQDPVLYCLAMCARSDDKDTKNKAYRILNEVCRIPTHLFQFIEYYTKLTQQGHKYGSVLEKEIKRKAKQDKREKALEKKNKTMQDDKKTKLKQQKVNNHATYGWGRAFKYAISKWFLSFESNPEYLAYLLTKYRRRCGWSVKVVIKLAHIKSPDIDGTEKKKKQKKETKEAEGEDSTDASPDIIREQNKRQLVVREDSSDNQKAIGFILSH